MSYAEIDVSLQTYCMQDSYLTIARRSEGLYKEKGSKFLAFAEPVSTPDEAKQAVERYRKTYHDARHVCYAYIVGADHDTWRANDDGEPSGTAGRPILGQLNAQQLTNTLIVVVRYFGGILLGTGGLTVAYKTAAADALRNAQTVRKDVTLRRTLRFPIERMNDIMRLIKETDSRILSQQYNGEYIIECEIKQVYDERFQ